MKEQNIFLDAANILSSDIGTSQIYQIDQKIDLFDKDVIAVGDLVGRITLEKLEEEQLVAFFNLKITVQKNCDLCLKKFKIPVNLNYEQTYGSNEKEKEFKILKNRTINVYSSIRQEILLAMPIKSVCSKNCKGIKVKF